MSAIPDAANRCRRSNGLPNEPQPRYRLPPAFAWRLKSSNEGWGKQADHGAKTGIPHEKGGDSESTLRMAQKVAERS
jgi:hypothetical protein